MINSKANHMWEMRNDSPLRILYFHHWMVLKFLTSVTTTYGLPTFIRLVSNQNNIIERYFNQNLKKLINSFSYHRSAISVALDDLCLHLKTHCFRRSWTCSTYPHQYQNTPFPKNTREKHSFIILGFSILRRRPMIYNWTNI